MYHGDRPWPGGRRFTDLLEPIPRSAGFARLEVDFEYVVDDFTRVPDDQIRRRGIDAVGRIALLALKHGRSGSQLLDRILEWAAIFDEVAGEPAGRESLWILLSDLAQAPPWNSSSRLRRNSSDGGR